jgi:hypothetical protein
MFTLPYDVLLGEPPTTSQFFSLLYVFGAIAACTFFLWYSGTIAAAAAEPAGLDTAKIESITGLKGVLNEKENTFKVSKPRSDVPITVEQARLGPFMGFTSWVAFAPGMKEEVMVMGDVVLFEDEVNTVMSVALDNGLQVTALHNHFFFDEPKVCFMHIRGVGPIDELGEAAKVIRDKKRSAINRRLHVNWTTPHPLGSVVKPADNQINLVTRSLLNRCVWQFSWTEGSRLRRATFRLVSRHRGDCMIWKTRTFAA